MFDYESRRTGRMAPASPQWAGLEGRHPVRRWNRPELDVMGQAPQPLEQGIYPVEQPAEQDTTRYMHPAQKRIF